MTFDPTKESFDLPENPTEADLEWAWQLAVMKHNSTYLEVVARGGPLLEPPFSPMTKEEHSSRGSWPVSAGRAEERYR